jgi:hypothetical protein
MERLDFHVALELCEIFIESATLVAIVFALSACLFMSLNSHRQSRGDLALANVASVTKPRC